MDDLGTLRSSGYIFGGTAALMLMLLAIEVIPLEYADFLLFVAFVVLSAVCFIADRVVPRNGADGAKKIGTGGL